LSHHREQKRSYALGTCKWHLSGGAGWKVPGEILATGKQGLFQHLRRESEQEVEVEEKAFSTVHLILQIQRGDGHNDSLLRKNQEAGHKPAYSAS
jgi:hypothetical protein